MQRLSLQQLSPWAALDCILMIMPFLVLLFTFWYCHRRGRDVRLARERSLTEEEIEKLASSSEASEIFEGPGGAISNRPVTTTAPAGAPIDEVREGIQEAKEARRQKEEAEKAPETYQGDDVKPSSLGTTVQKSEATNAEGAELGEAPGVETTGDTELGEVDVAAPGERDPASSAQDTTEQKKEETPDVQVESSGVKEQADT